VAEQLSDRIERQLAVYLGPHTARTAVRTFSLKAVGKPPEELTLVDAPKVVEALRPMLRTLLGTDQSESLLDQLQEELAR
jgi:hypothetical protein